MIGFLSGGRFPSCTAIGSNEGERDVDSQGARALEARAKDGLHLAVVADGPFLRVEIAFFWQPLLVNFHGEMSAWKGEERLGLVHSKVCRTVFTFSAYQFVSAGTMNSKS